MELLLMAHGAVKTGADPGGRGASRGRQTAGAEAWGMDAGAGLAPEHTLAAPTPGARTSAEKALKAGGWHARDIVSDPLCADGAAVDLAAALAAQGGARLLCVGPPETLTRLLHHLCSEADAMLPGSLVRLDGLRLRDRVVADDLPEGFPYPGPGARERRPRPAYYYTQSAALPYRLREGAPQVLVITSSSGRKWGIPKGICEPGLSPAASAAQEAEEEAGALGEMLPDCIGRYEVAKWGAICRVAVYPLRVTRMLPETLRDEPHRQRLWLSPAAAAARVSDPGLAALIAGWTPG